MKEEKVCEDIFMNKNMKDSIQYDKEIKSMSRWLARGDRFLAEELRSEMHIAILNMEQDQDKAFCLRVAKCRAIDYLRSRARNYSYGGAFKHVSLDALMDAGFQIDTMGNVYAPRNDYSADIGEEDTSDTDKD